MRNQRNYISEKNDTSWGRKHSFYVRMKDTNLLEGFVGAEDIISVA